MEKFARFTRGRRSKLGLTNSLENDATKTLSVEQWTVIDNQYQHFRDSQSQFFNELRYLGHDTLRCFPAFKLLSLKFKHLYSTKEVIWV